MRIAGTIAAGAAADTSCSDIAETVEAAATAHTTKMQSLRQQRTRAAARYEHLLSMRARLQRYLSYWQRIDEKKMSPTRMHAMCLSARQTVMW